MPPDASLDGHRIDWLLHITNFFAAVLFLIMVIWMLLAVVKHGRDHKAEYDHGNSRHSMIVACSISVFIFLIVDGNLFYHSVVDLDEAFWNWDKVEGSKPLRVEINARQWAWQFRYPGDDDIFNTQDDIITFNELSSSIQLPKINIFF